MRNFQDIFETRKRTFISAFSVCMTVPLMWPFNNRITVNIEIAVSASYFHFIFLIVMVNVFNPFEMNIPLIETSQLMYCKSNDWDL